MNGLLKFITCGSVDDGKSTLIGHLLYDAKLIFADQQNALEMDSRLGNREGALDYSLLLDGLMAEREQGITIDVAYRYFTTRRRSFIVADCPGHEQYTRNMAVGASFADLAVILVDVQHGITQQTCRHVRICSLMGIQHFVLAVNKMDLVDFEAHAFVETEMAFKRYLAEFSVQTLQSIPLSATEGDNIIALSPRMRWYSGKSLLSYLEDIQTESAEESDTFCMPIQRVCRPSQTFRGFQGEIICGHLRPGDEIKALPGGEYATVRKILLGAHEAKSAHVGQPVTVQLDREIDISRGSVLQKGEILCEAGILEATMLWMDDRALIPGRSYLLKCGTKTLPAEVVSIRHKVEMTTGKHIAAQKLKKNEIGDCEIALSSPLIFSRFQDLKPIGRFILIDRISHMTAGCGIISQPLHRAATVTWQDSIVTPANRALQKGQKPLTLWFTGLSGAGKSTIANQLERMLVEKGMHTMLLDGDNLRYGLNKDLGFSEMARVENIRRVAEVSRILNDAGIIALSALISPYRADRQRAREIIGTPFIEVYVNTPLAVCEARDVKGLYRRARDGDLPEFTGISSPYEAPEMPDIAIDTSQMSLEDACAMLWNEIFPRIGR